MVSSRRLYHQFAVSSIQQWILRLLLLLLLPLFTLDSHRRQATPPTIVISPIK